MAIRLLTFLSALALATLGLATQPAPVAAAHAVPWRFATVTLNTSISGYAGAEPIKGWVLQCPAGYTAVSGGVAGGDAISQVRVLLAYPGYDDGTYHLILRNAATSGTALTLAANCVWLDDVGSITLVTQSFTRNGSGRAGGPVECPPGTLVLSGATDWDTTDADKRIDFSTPITGNTQYGIGWYAEGYSDVSNSKLYVEVRCVDASLLTAEYATADDSSDAVPGFGDATAQCVSGYRTLTGGVGPAGTFVPGTYHGTATSGPSGPRSWPARGYQTGAAMRAMALCVPASTASVTLTLKPPLLSNQRSGSFTFQGTDTAGETLTYSCKVDGLARACTAGALIPYGPLADGIHLFEVAFANQSGSAGVLHFGWEIDATAPVLIDHAPSTGASLTAPISMMFSESVTGVTGSSIVVHAEAANKDVAGSVSQPDSHLADWSHAARFVPGETYRVSLTSAIEDTAGNALIPTFFNVRAKHWVDNTSAAMTKLWDRDTSATASGGGFIVDRLSGAKAEHTFTATAGQTVSVYGIRMPDGGNAEIWLDGVKKATASFYAASTSRARVYLSGALTAGKHTISIRPTGTRPAASSAAWVRIDNVQVGATVTQETALKQFFRKVTAASAHDGSYDQIVQKSGDTTPAQFRVTGVGSGIKVFATKNSVSGSARIYVDGVLKATVNLKSAGTVYKALVYSAAFSLGTHTVRVEAVGTATGVNSQVNLDRITFT